MITKSRNNRYRIIEEITNSYDSRFFIQYKRIGIFDYIFGEWHTMYLNNYKSVDEAKKMILLLIESDNKTYLDETKKTKVIKL